MAASEVIQFRVSKEEKRELIRRSKERNATLSETIREDLALDQRRLSPLEKFEIAQQRAAQDLASSGLPELSEADIVAYCNEIKRVRAEEAAFDHAG